MVRPMLVLLQRITQLESTYLTTIDQDEGIQHILFVTNHGALQIREGADVPWHDTLCRRALEEGCLAADDVPRRWADSSAAAELGLQTYVSTPVLTESGALFGTLCGASQESISVNDPELRDVLKLFSELIAHQVDREAQAQRSRQRAEAAEGIAAEMSLLSRIGDLCLNARELQPVLTETAQLLGERGHSKHAVPFQLDDASREPAWSSHAGLLDAISGVLRTPEITHADNDPGVHGHLLPLDPDNPAVRQLRAAAGLTTDGSTRVVTVATEDGLQAGILLFADEATPLTNSEARVLGNCSSYLSLLAERLAYLRRLHEANRELSQHALHDPLTGLPNRRYLVEELGRMLARAARSKEAVHVAFVDLDDFKAINDHHGHEAGDQFLKALGGRLLDSMRTGDLVSRYGGDEFVLVATAGDPCTAERERSQLADRIARATTGAFELPAVTLDYGGPSVGVITCDAHESDADRILARADEAMYAVKKRRRTGR
ncbi:GGDEF domain-containing protein [Aquisalimonas lutea]|uniref:GGDEF domain-containing protein n=1 Tax=Aquisalimonas lutea TaxID=1327750 RepID=UPI0025B5F6E8|nr:GGDEF domain-containing protein [Aquisalimonas lutea]MDN3517440.1 GGDEF domain-containing protein [Aquisalimonas lutea]